MNNKRTSNFKEKEYTYISKKKDRSEFSIRKEFEEFESETLRRKTKKKFKIKLNIENSIDLSPKEQFQDSSVLNLKSPQSPVKISEKQPKERSSKKSKEKKLFSKDILLFPKEVKQQPKVESESATSSVIPWLTSRTINNKGLMKLHYEILDFYEFIRPTEEENKNRQKTFMDLKALIKTEFPDYKVKLFGSYPVGLHLPESDIDIIVICNAKSDSNKNALEILKKIANKLYSEEKVSFINVIEAKVPIIRAEWAETKINIDISANRKNGYAAQKVIKSVLSATPCIRPLIYVLKYFLKKKNINETFSGGISSFLLFNLLFSHIQQLKKDKDIDVAKLTLGEIMCRFFQLYGFDFNYEEVGISIRNGGFFYKKEDKHWFNQTRPKLLSVENFQDIEQDVGRSAFKIGNIIEVFKKARDALYFPSASPVMSYLADLIPIDEELKKRKPLKTQENVILA